MRRYVIPFVLITFACGTEPRPGTTTPEATPTPTPSPTEATEPSPTEAVDVAAPTPQGGTAVVHASIIDAARSAKAVEKVKLRVDDGGAIVKQTVYHVDAARIPEPVHALAKKEFPGSKELRFENEVYADIGEIFEVEVQTKDGKRCEVAANAAGELRYKECRVKPKELPKEVSAKIKELHPKGKIIEAETKNGPSVDEITAEVQEGGKQFYVRLKPDGTVIQSLLRVTAVFEVPLP